MSDNKQPEKGPKKKGLTVSIDFLKGMLGGGLARRAGDGLDAANKRTAAAAKELER